jgi:hypothetical protein
MKVNFVVLTFKVLWLKYVYVDVIIHIPSPLVFALTPYCWVLSGEAANANFIIFGLTQPGLKLTIYHTQGKHANHYTT